MSDVMIRDQRGTIRDPRLRYEFSAPEVPSRTIVGEGTKVMLTNAHPEARFIPLDFDEAAAGVQPLLRRRADQPLAEYDEATYMEAVVAADSTPDPVASPARGRPRRFAA